MRATETNLDLLALCGRPGFQTGWQKITSIEAKTMSEAENKIKMYGTNWCYGSRQARKLLDTNEIAYDYIDIDLDMDARSYVEQVNNGYRSVPTLIFPDGSMLVEPSSSELRLKLGLS
jgi:mycoredoxin